MLTHARVTTILPVLDLNRARTFYEGKLGLQPEGAKANGSFIYACGDARLALTPRACATKAEHTAVSFLVPDIASSIAELEDRGVVFSDYDLPGLKTVDHVCVLGSEKAAWFNDPEGNILCLHEDIA